MPMTKSEIAALANPPPNDFEVLPINEQELSYLERVDPWLLRFSRGEMSIEDFDFTVINLIEIPNNADQGLPPPDHGRYFVIRDKETGETRYSNYRKPNRKFWRVQSYAAFFLKNFE